MKTNLEVEKVGTVDHLGLVVNDLEEVAQNYWKILGIDSLHITKIEPGRDFSMNYRGNPASCSYRSASCSLGAAGLELIESVQGPNPYKSFLESSGEGAYKINSFSGSLSELNRYVRTVSDMGYSVILDGSNTEKNGFALLDTLDSLKTNWESLTKTVDRHARTVIRHPLDTGELCEASVKVNAINRIGLVVENLEAVAESYRNILGVGPWEVVNRTPPVVYNLMYRRKPVKCAWKLGMSAAGPLEIELIQPVSGSNIFREFLDDRGEGIHHIQFLVDDIDETNRQMEAAGFSILFGGRVLDGGFSFYDTVEPLKIVWEALQPPKTMSPDSYFI